MSSQSTGPVKTPSIRTMLDEQSGSAFQRYRMLTIGERGIWYFIAYELTCLLALPFPGAFGFVLRRVALGRLLGGCGRGVIIGRNCVFRHPSRIFLEDRAVIDDECVLDARGTGPVGIRIGESAIISRGTILQSKGGPVSVGAGTNIGARCQLVSWSGIRIGADVAIAGDCSLSAGTYSMADFAKRPVDRKPQSAGPIVIDDGAWLATRVTILDGVHIGAGAIVSAGSVVTSEVPPRTIVQGNPARKVFTIR